MWLWRRSGAGFLSLQKRNGCGMVEVYTTRNDAKKMSWEGLLTGSHSPSTRIIRPRILKAEPRLVQKVVKCLLLEAGRVYDRKRHSIFADFYSFSLKISYLLLLRAADYWNRRANQFLPLPYILQSTFLMAVLNSSCHVNTDKGLGKRGSHFSLRSGMVQPLLVE